MSQAKQLRALQDLLSPGEELLHATGAGFTADTNAHVWGMAAVTNRRILFSGRSMTKRIFHEVSFESVAGFAVVEHFGRSASFKTTISGGEIIAWDINKSEAPKFLEAAQAALAARASAGHTSPPSASIADELSKLADLHARGLLSDSEFASAKARLL